MTTTNTIRLIEAEGFRDGTQQVKPTAALEEIDKHFGQRKELKKIATTDRIKTLQGNIENIAQRKFDTDRHWADLEMQTGGMPPPIILFLCAVVFSGVVVFGETVFLAPVLDGIGIADPAWQYLLAAGIVLVCSGLFEITKKQWQPINGTDSTEYESDQQKSMPRWPRMVFLGFVNLLAMLLVSILGWWRAEEMIFAAKAQARVWQDFLRENATLTRVVIVLLTVSLPIFVAMAFDWGISGLRFAWEWRKTRSDYKKLTAELPKKRKQLESEEEKAQSQQQALDALREEWKQSYLQNHELGQKVGAQQLPGWQIIVKVVAVILLLIAVCLLINPLLSGYVVSDSARYVLYACLVTGLGGIYNAYTIKAWDRPNTEQLYAQKAVNWRRVPDYIRPISNRP